MLTLLTTSTCFDFKALTPDKSFMESHGLSEKPPTDDKHSIYDDIRGL